MISFIPEMMLFCFKHELVDLEPVKTTFLKLSLLVVWSLHTRCAAASTLKLVKVSLGAVESACRLLQCGCIIYIPLLVFAASLAKPILLLDQREGNQFLLCLRLLNVLRLFLGLSELYMIDLCFKKIYIYKIRH